MSAVALVLSQCVALFLGSAAVALLIRRGPGAVASIAGYGYLLGLIAMTLVLRVMSVVGVDWTFVAPAAVALIMGAGLLALNRAWLTQRDLPLAVEPGTRASRIAVCLIAVAILAHLGLVAYEALTRPLFPWDASAQWATKARVWFDAKHIVPFVDDLTWARAASNANLYTDAHPTYPATVPLFQTWAALAWGSWDDAVANISWPLTLAALAAACYGQLRRLGFVPLAAVAVAYAVVSLPFVDVHAALAGYADLAISSLLALSLLGLMQWSRTRSPRDALLTMLCALALPLLKAPGWIWLATIAAGFVFSVVPWRVFRVAAITAALLVIGVLGYSIEVGPVTVLGYVLQGQPSGVVNSLIANLYVFASWHLLWLVVPLLLLADRKRLLHASIGPATVTVASGAVFLAVVFFFSNAGEEGVEAITTINRAILHMVPALVCYAAVLVDDLWRLTGETAPPPAIAAT